MKRKRNIRRMNSFNLKSPKKKNINMFLGKHKNDLRLNWNQVKKKYPSIKPYQDSDFDGTLNLKDCRPLNPAADGRIGELFKQFVQRDEMKKPSLSKEKRKRIWAESKERKYYAEKRAALKERITKRKERREIRRKIFENIRKRAATQVQKSFKQLRTKKPSKASVRLASKMTGLPVISKKKKKSQSIQQQMKKKRLQAIRTMPVQPIQQTPSTNEAEIQREVSEIPEGYHQMPDGRLMRGNIHSSYLPEQRYKIVTDIMTGRKIIRPLPPREKWTE